MSKNLGVTGPGKYVCVYAHSGWFTENKTYIFYEVDKGVLYTTSDGGYKKPLSVLGSKFEPAFESLEGLL